MRRLTECQTIEVEKEWILRKLKLIVMGVEDPIAFLWDLNDKFEIVHAQDLRKDFKVYKILNREKIEFLNSQKTP